MSPVISFILCVLCLVLVWGWDWVGFCFVLFGGFVCLFVFCALRMVIMPNFKDERSDTSVGFSPNFLPGRILALKLMSSGCNVVWPQGDTSNQLQLLGYSLLLASVLFCPSGLS